MYKRWIYLLLLMLVLVFTACGPNGNGKGGGKPATPKGLSAVAANGEVTLNWQANTEADLLKYNIYYGTQSGNLDLKQDVAKDKTSTTISGFTKIKSLAKVSDYFFAISAVNTSQKESDLSAEVKASTASTAPATPKNFKATPGNQKVTLSWVANTEQNLKQYVIYFGKDQNNLNNTKIANKNLSSIIITGLQNKTKYYFKIEAENNLNEKSKPSQLVSATPDLNDNIAPKVNSIVPNDKAKDVPTGTVIKVKFSEEMNKNKTTINVTPAVTCSYNWNSSFDELSCNPAAEFDASKTYHVEVVGEDLAANKLANYSSSFTTADKAGPGSIDKTFGVNGVFIPSFDVFGDAIINDLVVDNNKIYVVGKTAVTTANKTKSHMFLARLNSDGSLDTSFANNGITKPSFSQGGDRALAMLIYNNKLYIVGGSDDDADLLMLSFNLDGSLNTAFNGTGVLKKDFGTTRENGIYLTVDRANGNLYVLLAIDSIFAVDSSGKTILSFATNGLLDISAEYHNSTANSIAVINHKLLVVGSIGTAKGADMKMIMVKNDGSFDSSFSTDGKVTVDISKNSSDYAYDNIDSITISNGKILIAGGSNHRFAILRYDFNGNIDKQFANQGVLIDSIAGEYIIKLLLDKDNKIVAVGRETNNKLAIARYNTDGKIDTSFGLSGHSMFNTIGQPQAAVFDKDNKIVVVGFNASDSQVTRVLP